MSLAIRAAKITCLPDLHAALQNAIRLEHATIPLYLTAMYSIKDGTNQDILALIRSIVMEEMLHFGIACNIMNAIGGSPGINAPDFLPAYPGPLPMGIGDENGQKFYAHLRKLSLPQVQDIFMRIEEPEDPIVFPVLAVDEFHHTIGEFYAGIKHWIRKEGESLFLHPSNPQVVGVLGLTSIHNVQTACDAIDLIIQQGEGTRTLPTDPEQELAHFYKFEEIVKGRTLISDPKAPKGYSFSGPPIVLDPAGVYDMIDDPNTNALPAGSQALLLSQQFDYSYTSLLNALHQAFNGDPKQVEPAIGLMFSLKVQAQTLMQTPIPGNANGQTAGPSYLYRPVQ